MVKRSEMRLEKVRCDGGKERYGAEKGRCGEALLE